MQINNYFILLLGFFSFLSGAYLEKPNAVMIKVPIADCLGLAAKDIDPSLLAFDGTTKEFYDHLAYSPEAGPYSCARIHQCLFNEVGIIREEKGDELLVEFPHFYHKTPTGAVESHFWLHRSSVKLLADLKVPLTSCIPEPLNYQQITPLSEQTLTLVFPWQDPLTSCWYSAGTRFLHNAAADTDTCSGLNLINHSSDSVRTALVPHTYLLLALPKNITEAKQLFVKILRSWITHSDGSIPYAWGGCSYVGRCPAKDFMLWEGVRGTDKITNWQRPSAPGVRSGFDCTGVILRAAQMAGIRYFCKNTTTIGLTFKDVPKDEPLEEGDFIFFKGHVLVISDLQKNLAIDSCSYGSGYGCLREVPLSESTVDVTTYEELRHRANTNQSLGRKNIQGELFTLIPSFRLIRLTHQDIKASDNDVE